jgi:hypothetical protein
LTPFEKSSMASAIAEESASIFKKTIQFFLLVLPCRPCNLQALVLGMFEPTNGGWTSSSFPWPKKWVWCGVLS